MSALGFIIAAIIIIADLLAVIFVLRLGSRHDAHQSVSTVESSNAVQMLRAQAEAAARKAEAATTKVEAEQAAAVAEKASKQAEAVVATGGASEEEQAEQRKAAAAAARARRAAAQTEEADSVEAPAIKEVVAAAQPAVGAIGALNDDAKARKREEALKRKAARNG